MMVQPKSKKQANRSAKNKSQRNTEEALQRSSKDYGLADKLSRIFFSWVQKKRGVLMSPLHINIDHYEIKGLICAGTFGKVLMATNLKTNLTAAAKIEPKDSVCPQLLTEYKIYEILGCDIPGFIKIYYYGTCEKFNVLIMELLGPDLDDLFVTCKETFSLKTVLMIALQTIQLIRYIHKNNIVYRDIKPENFCIGHWYQHKEKIIHVIDFGLAKMNDYSISTSNIRLDDKRYDYLIGTARYMSVNAHFAGDQSKRDDLESLVYMYAYFLKGRLPWMGLSRAANITDHYKSIANLKKTTKPEELIGKHSELIEFFKYVKQLKYMEEPDYDYIENLINNAFKTNDFVDDKEFDWTQTMNKKYLLNAIEVDPDD